MAAYEAKYGHPVENAFAALGYDTVYLLADAIERAGSMDGAALKGAIETTTGLPGHHRLDHLHPRGARAPEGRDHHRGRGPGASPWRAEVVPESVPAP